MRVLSSDEMPEDNADLASIPIDFPRLAEDSPSGCPVPLTKLLAYLGSEVPGGDRLSASDLVFARTALVSETRYWIWRFNEPDGGDPAYVTVSVQLGVAATLGYGNNCYNLSPEQFILGDYHQVF